MVFYDYENRTALDPYTGAGAPNAVGQVFAKTDTTFSTPLTAVLMGSGLQATDLTTDQYSQLPGFQVEDHMQVVFKSGDFTKVLNTTTPLVGPQGASVNQAVDNGDGTVTLLLEDGTVAATVALPEGPQGDPGPQGLPATNAAQDDAALATFLTTDGTATATALKTTIAPVKDRARREIERTATGLTRRAAIPAGLGWTPAAPILTDGARYWSPVDVETMRPAGGKTFYISPAHGASTGSGQELGTLTTPVAIGETVTSLAITASAQSTNSTARLAVIVGTEFVPVTVSASVAVGATTVTIQSLTPGIALPRGSKLVAVRNRLHDIYGPTLNYVAAGDTVVFLDKVNYNTAIQALLENKGIGLVGLRPGTIITMTEKETWTLTSGNVYQAARTSVRNVVDIAADKDGFEYTRVGSVAECEALPGSWFQATDGTGAVYVRTLQGGAPNPEIHHALLTTENIDFAPPGGSTVFLKNLRFIGGLDTVTVDGSEATPVRFLVKDCDMLWGGYGPVGATDATIASSLHIRGNVEAYMQRFRVGHSTRDAIDYVGLNGYGPRFMEIDCEAFACGTNSISLAADPTNATFNGSTAHDGAVGVRVGGKYHDARGTVVADVHVGTKSANYGLDVWGSTSSFDLFNAAIAAQQDGTVMWLYGCRTWGTKNDIVSVGTAVMNVLEGTEYDSLGGDGTLTVA